MAGDTPPAPPPRLQREPSGAITVGDLLAFAEWMRGLVADAKDELRSDIAGQHDVLMAKVDVVTNDQRELAAVQRDFAVVHAQEHIRESTERKLWQDKLTGFIHTAEIAKARRDGILGVARFAFNLLGTNWRGIVAITGLAGVLSGTFHVDLGLRQ